MNIKVLYHSMTGNTKKVAEAIAAVANVPAEAITGSESIAEPVDLLFLGDGIYAGGMAKQTKRFLENLDGSRIKQAAVFGTYGGQTKVITAMADALREKGISISKETFSCKGQAWGLANRNHPDENDLNAARQFAADILRAAGAE